MCFVIRVRFIIQIMRSLDSLIVYRTFSHTAAELQEMITMMDTDDDGKINKADFLRIMTRANIM